MTQTQRVQAVLEFEKNSSIKVMVASLKCGGTGKRAFLPLQTSLDEG